MTRLPGKQKVPKSSKVKRYKPPKELAIADELRELRRRVKVLTGFFERDFNPIQDQMIANQQKVIDKLTKDQEKLIHQNAFLQAKLAIMANAKTTSRDPNEELTLVKMRAGILESLLNDCIPQVAKGSALYKAIKEILS